MNTKKISIGITILIITLTMCIHLYGQVCHNDCYPRTSRLTCSDGLFCAGNFVTDVPSGNPNQAIGYQLGRSCGVNTISGKPCGQIMAASCGAGG